MTALLKRIAAEKRAIIAPLVIALVANLLGYGVVVRPRRIKAEGAADRAVQAAGARRAAEAEEAVARALVTGKVRADQELNAFYQKVLPADFDAARRMTYAALPALARKTRVQWEARTSEIDPGEKDARLGRMAIRMVLQGDYENLRQFVYALESAAEFVIIDDVALTEAKPNDPVTLVVRMSTYYRLRPHGA